MSGLVSIGLARLAPMGPTTSSYHDFYPVHSSLHSPSVPAHAGTDGECREGVKRVIERLVADQL